MPVGRRSAGSSAMVFVSSLTGMVYMTSVTLRPRRCSGRVRTKRADDPATVVRVSGSRWLVAVLLADVAALGLLRHLRREPQGAQYEPQQRLGVRTLDDLDDAPDDHCGESEDQQHDQADGHWSVVD